MTTTNATTTTDTTTMLPPVWGHQKFGVEIEMKGVSQRRVINQMIRVLGLRPDTYAFSTDHRGIGIKDTAGRTWKAVYDGSVGSGGCEVVTPPCVYADIPVIQEMVRQFRSIGARVDSACGIHIHVDATPHSGKSLATLVKMVAAREDILFKSLDVLPARRRWCGQVSEALIQRLEGRRRSREGLRRSWYQAHNTSGGSHYDGSRYHGVNLHAVFDKGTVEFRYFNATLHAGELRAYINLCLAISHRALMSSGASARRRCSAAGRSGATQYRVMFQWLTALGLKGKEWKVVRKHFLKNLSHNDSAVVLHRDDGRMSRAPGSGRPLR